MYLVVNRRNPYFRPGAFIRRFDDGWEEVRMDKQEGSSRLRQTGYKGLVIPLNVIDMTKFAVPVMAKGAPPPEYMHRQKRLIIS